MATVNYFRAGGTGSTKIPITGGTQVIDLTGLSMNRETHYFYIAFEDSAGAIATPSSGDVKFEGKPDSNVDVWDDIPDGDFKAKDVYDSARARPVGQGPMVAARLTLDSIVGADFAIARVAGY